MANTIRIKRRSSAGAIGLPPNLAPAELAYNEADNTLYYGFGDQGGMLASTVIPIAGTGAFMTTSTSQTISASKTFSNITVTGGSISGITDLAVVDGGTGSSTASGARANLAAAGLGANSDITSLAGLTTALSIIQGGTGSTTAIGARVNLLPSYAGNEGKVIAVKSDGTDIEYIVPTAGGGGSGSVTSVALTVPNILSVSGSPVTSSGTLAINLASQAINTIFAGPTGSTGVPTFRALVSADVPALAYLPSSGGTVSGALIVTGDLTVQGSTTTISSNTLLVNDKNIELATGNVLEAGATGGGITLHGLTDHTILYTSSTSSWDFSEHMNLLLGKEYKINGNSVLSATALMGVDVDGGAF